MLYTKVQSGQEGGDNTMGWGKPGKPGTEARSGSEAKPWKRQGKGPEAAGRQGI